MPWFKVDDSFYDHPKVFDAPDCAVALWVRAGTWSARNLTNGFVPSGMPARLCDDHDTAVRELVRRGLWKRTGGGYQFHDWPEYQPSADEVKELRSKRAEAGRLGGLAKAAKQNAGKALANASHVAKQNAAPTRPDPTPKGGSSKEDTHVARDPGLEPPPKCLEHHDNPDPPPCGRCKQARETHEQWDRDRVRAEADARQAKAREQAEMRQAEIDRCGLCNRDGYRDGRRCTHDPQIAERARQRAAQIRASIAKPTRYQRQEPEQAINALDAEINQLTPPSTQEAPDVDQAAA